MESWSSTDSEDDKRLLYSRSVGALVPVLLFHAAVIYKRFTSMLK
jgi:hypothetical protein